MSHFFYFDFGRTVIIMVCIAYAFHTQCSSSHLLWTFHKNMFQKTVLSSSTNYETQIIITLRTWNSLTSLQSSQKRSNKRCSTVSLVSMVTSLHMICKQNIIHSQHRDQNMKLNTTHKTINTVSCRQYTDTHSVTDGMKLWQEITSCYLFSPMKAHGLHILTMSIFHFQ